MSLLPAEVTAELSQLLQALQSPDNSIRSQAENVLQENWTALRPEVLLMGLVEQIAGNPDSTIRSFAAVIFRRISGKTRKGADGEAADTYMTLDKGQADIIRQRLLETLPVEAERGVRNKISDAVAELARQCTENGVAWPELLSALFTMSSAPDAGKREIAFRVFATTPGIMEKQNDETIVLAFSRALKDDTVAVRLAAMDAFGAFFRILGKKNKPKYFGLLPELLNILPPIKEAQDSEDLSKALLALIELAENAPKMFRQQFTHLVAFSISVIQDKELSDTCRQNALELMATFADVAPSMCKKDPSYTNDMITQCLSLMTDLGEDDDDASEWLASEELDQDDSDLNHMAGEQCMDRLATRLGGEAVLAPTFNWLPRMMASVVWRDRHAALMAISAISEGCRELMLGELNQVLELVVPALKDPHPRVRWAGCNALGQMSTDFAPNMQKDHHETVLKAIIPVLDCPEARVKSHAAAALVNFCEEAEKSVLEPYLDDLLSHLFRLMTNEKRFVQEQALSTIATIADAAEKTFAKYYSHLMPVLVGVLEQENAKEYRLLRAKAMECATLIALAVGREQLGEDALKLLQLLAKVQQSIQDADDPQAQYLLHCWGRMCRVLGEEFLPYLHNVMPPLLELASAKADIQLLDDEDQIDQVQRDEGWEVVPLKGKMICIRTSTLDDKHTAIELLVVYAQVLGAGFAPYVPDIMQKIALPGLAFFFHDPVRFMSARLVPQLLSSYKSKYGAGSAELAQLWLSIVDKLLEVLVAEPAVETLAEMYQCFYEAVDVMATNCLTDALMNKFIDSVTTTLEDYMDRVALREEDREGGAGEDEDENEETLIAIEDDQTLLSDMNKAFHVVFKYHGTSFLGPWERLMSTYEKFLKSDETTQRQWGLCIIDDVLEYCGTESIRYASFFSQPLLNGLRDPSPAIRQAAAYGIGVAAQKGGAAWSEFLAGCLEALFDCCKVPEPRSDDNVYATENACAAIAKILHFNSAHVPNIDNYIANWTLTLPVINDEEAAPYTFMYMAELLAKQHPALASQPLVVLSTILQGLQTEVLSGQAAKTIITAAKPLFTAAGDSLAPVLSAQTPEVQQAFQTIYNSS